MTDFTSHRTTMVDTQVRPSDVTKFPIIEAMLAVPREVFVPDTRRDAAYADESIDLGHGRLMLEPRTIAKLLDGLNIQPNEVVLDIGCGLGYSTAIMARMSEFIVALEHDEAMVAEAQSTLSEHGIDNVAVVSGPLSVGAPKHGPYDVIFIEGAIEKLPSEIKGQLKEGGRIACLFSEGALGIARIGIKINDTITWQYLFNAGAPVLAGFEAETTFNL